MNRAAIVGAVLGAALVVGLALSAGGSALGSGAIGGGGGGSSGGTASSETTFNAPINLGCETLTYAASVAIDASTKPCKTVSLTGNITFTTTGLAADRLVTIIITSDGSTRTLTFPAGWKWIGSTVPASIVASKVGVLSLTATTGADSGVLASFGPQDATVNAAADITGVLPLANGGTGNATGAGAMVAYTVKTSGTTITSTSTTHTAYVIACAAGGGGGGTTTAAVSAAVGGGGAAGGCVGKLYTGLTPSTTFTYAIGTAGTAGSNAGGNGGTGGDSTFTDGTTLITAKGGLGGLGEAAGTALAYVDGGGGVISTNGDWNGAGAPGTNGTRLSGLIGGSGSGGSCAYGGGGIGSSTAAVGATALGRCSGGAGGLVLNNSTAVAGGAATGGVVIFEEYQ